MPDLEQQIGAWRREMLAARVPVEGVDELESHLREDIAREIRSGRAETDAFTAAVRRIGEAAALRHEFKKNNPALRASVSAKRAVFAFAGVPDGLAPSMSTPDMKFEPAWASYTKGVLFLAPVICLWMFSLIRCVPRLNEMCAHLGVPLPAFIRLNLGIAASIRDHSIFFFGGALVVFGLLEWRAWFWPRWRRAALGFGAFILNLAFLFCVFGFLFITVALASNVINHHVK